MSEFWQTVIGVLGSIGIGGAIVAGFSSWVGKVWANRLMAKESAKFREVLERLTKQLERKNYVSKVRFDTEFAIYRELSKNLVLVVQNARVLFPDKGLQYAPVDKQEQIYIKNYQDACRSYNTFSSCLASNCAFIVDDIYHDFESIREKIDHQIQFYHRLFLSGNRIPIDTEEEQTCWSYTEEIYDELKTLQNKLRNYLKTLDVMDQCEL